MGSPPPLQALIPLYSALTEELGGGVGRADELEPGHFQRGAGD